MKLRTSVLLFFFGSQLAVLAHAAGSLVAGPMLGYNTQREVFVWLETKDASSVVLEYWPAGQPAATVRLVNDHLQRTPAGGQISHFTPGRLTPGTAYEYSLTVDGARLSFPYPLKFKPRALWEWRSGPPDFKFLAGSCAYINEPALDRPGEGYGKTLETFRLAAETGADFMVWLGDNWYYREPDYSSVSGLWHRAQHDRATPELRKLFAVMHHYATWDDHDYGPNDSNKSYELKDETLKIFRSYWGNVSYGERDNPGVYHKWYWGDAAFILLDDYFHRDDVDIDQVRQPEKSQWGRRQLEWVKQSLLQAQSLGHFPFKFIGNGTQILQTETRGSGHQLYQREREELLDFIREHGITGVVFLTGDAHHSGVYRRQLQPNGPWVYEITASPLSAGSWDVGKSAKARDPLLVKGTLVGDQNFVQIEVKGPREDRQLVISSIDKQGVKRFEHVVKAAELGAKPPTKPVTPGPP